MGVLRPVCNVIRGDPIFCDDYVYSTDTIDAAFGERDGRIGSLESAVNELRKDISEDRGAIAELDRRDRDFQSALDRLRNELATKADRSSIDTITTTLNSHAGSIGELYARVAELETWRSQVAPVIDLVNPDFVRMQIEQITAPLQQAVTSAVANVQQIEQETRARISQLEQSITQRIDQLVTDTQARVDAALAPVRDTIGQLQQLTQSALTQIQSVSASLAQLAQAVPRMISDYVDPRLRHISARIDTIVSWIPVWETYNLAERILREGIDNIIVSRITGTR
jgi:chromosome segregation ATPase